MGWSGGKTILDDYLREIRPFFRDRQDDAAHDLSARERSASSTSGSPSCEIPVGHGQTRKGYVVVACLGYSRAGAGALIFTKQTPDLLAGIRRCLWKLGGLRGDVGLGSPGRHPRPRRPPDAGVRRLLRPAEGRLALLRPRDPQAKGVVERWQGYAETNFEPGRVFANELDFQEQFDAWSAKVNARQHRTIRARPIDRLAEELEVMTALPQVAPDTDRRWVLRVAPDPYVRFDGCDYSLDPDLVGRRVEIRVGDRELIATRVRHRRAGLPAPAVVRAAPDDHRARARPRAQTPPRRSRVGVGGSDAVAGRL